MEGTMIEDTNIQIDEPNRWRLETPGHQGWPRTARPDDPNRYLMISADCHANEPGGLWHQRLDKKYHHRLPRIEVDEKGQKWVVNEGMQRSRLLDSRLAGEDHLRNKSGYTPEQRIADHRRDGIDAEIMFPNKGLSVWATTDADFGNAQCKVWNDWAWETYGAYNDFMSPIAAIMTADINLAIEEIKRVAKLGFRGVNLPCKPIFGAHDARHPNYNMTMFDPMWAAIQDCDVTVTFHISTGRDPRAARKDGGAIINYAAHALSPTVEPIACLCASGVLERFNKLRFAGIECGIGWVPWALEAMDEAARKHHMWAFPKLKKLPSDYFREHGAASFQDDPIGIELAERHHLVDNFMWANDYPHHEGSWPHSAQSIERQMGELKEESRAKILGLNAARIFKFDVEALLRRRSIPAD
jgi:predicted TIM-barrel fold metal-dependent hydrolase